MSECPVCLEEYNDSRYKPLECNHCICDGCFDKLAQCICPLCRASIASPRPLKFVSLVLDTEGYDELEEYYNSIVKQLVLSAVNKYNSDPDSHGAEIMMTIQAYYFAGKKPTCHMFSQLEPRITTLLYHSKLNNNIRCHFDGAVKNKDNRYFVSFEFIFTR